MWRKPKHGTKHANRQELAGGFGNSYFRSRRRSTAGSFVPWRFSERVGKEHHRIQRIPGAYTKQNRWFLKFTACVSHISCIYGARRAFELSCLLFHECHYHGDRFYVSDICQKKTISTVIFTSTQGNREGSRNGGLGGRTSMPFRALNLTCIVLALPIICRYTSM